MTEEPVDQPRLVLLFPGAGLGAVVVDWQFGPEPERTGIRPDEVLDQVLIYLDHVQRNQQWSAHTARAIIAINQARRHLHMGLRGLPGGTIP